MFVAVPRILCKVRALAEQAPACTPNRVDALRTRRDSFGVCRACAMHQPTLLVCKFCDIIAAVWIERASHEVSLERILFPALLVLHALHLCDGGIESERVDVVYHADPLGGTRRHIKDGTILVYLFPHLRCTHAAFFE